MTEFEVKTVEKENYILVNINGEIDSSNYEEFNEELVNIACSNDSSLIIDLNNTIGINSNGWGTFYRINDILKEKQKKIIFYGLSKFLYEIAVMLKFNDTFTITEDINESLKVLNEKN